MQKSICCVAKQKYYCMFHCSNYEKLLAKIQNVCFLLKKFTWPFRS